MRPPTDAPTELEDLYMDQVSLLNIIWEADMITTEKSGDEVSFVDQKNSGWQRKSYNVKEVICADPRDGNNAVGKCIRFRFEQPRYGVCVSLYQISI